MNVRSACVFVAIMGILVGNGCLTHKRFPDSSLTGTIHEVNIGESATPQEVTAKRGDEVRWVNMSDAPLDVSMVQTQEELISCQKGFASTNLGYVFGTSEYENIVMATVRPGGYAGLCFSLPGKYAYTIRRSPSGPGSASKMTGSISIE
jgi:plastocyanin